MLTQDYYYYIFKVIQAGMFSLAGVLGLLALVISAYLLVRMRKVAGRASVYGFWGAFSLFVVLSLVAFYTGVYEYPEDPGMLPSELVSDTGGCPAVWTSWIKGGYGTGNPCPSGCLRGITLRKQMTMTGFPPWPKYRRELQCVAAEAPQ